MATKNEIQNVMEGMGAKGESAWAFISDSNRADRQHPGGQHAQSREHPKQKAYSSSESSLYNAHLHISTNT